MFVAGGNRYADSNYDGTRQTATFDLADRSWARADSMDFARWYPSTTQLPDGDVLIMSGWETDHAEPVHRIERYHAGTGQITSLPSSADLDMRLYPRTFLLPGGDVLRVGPDEMTSRLDTTSWTWSNVDSMVHGLRIAGAAVLLPGLDRVLALGGARPDGTSATDTAEILELDQARPAWRSIAPMHRERLYMNAVLLADGDVLVVGGGRVAPWEGPVRTAELFDTQTETWRRMAPQAGSRMYHSTALLLPDGRVLSAGQNDGDLQRTAEIYSPPYLFRGPRPRITSAPRVAKYGEHHRRRNARRRTGLARGAHPRGIGHPQRELRPALRRPPVRSGEGRPDGEDPQSGVRGTPRLVHAVPGRRRRCALRRSLGPRDSREGYGVSDSSI